MTASGWELVEHADLLVAQDRFDDARRMFEQAFAELRAAGEVRAAARVAARLCELHEGALGSTAMARGWILRGHRVLEGQPPCVESGYLELARLACDRLDIDDLARSAAAALDIARAFGDVDLEVRALADSALALVTQGRAAEGFARIDEALAVLGSGEVRDLQIVGTSLCAVLASCDRAGDLDRALASIRVVEEMMLRPFDGLPRVLGTHCKVALGSVLCSAGRWQEGEATLLDAVGPGASSSVNHRTEAIAKLAELRVHQGRIDEAADLLAAIEDSIDAAAPLAMVHLARGNPDLAAGVLRGAVRRMIGDVTRGSSLLALLADAELARGDVPAARAAGSLLASMAAAVEVPALATLADAVDGRIKAASDDLPGALAAFDRALDRLGEARATTLAARLWLDVAECQAASGDQSAAIASARAAHAAAVRGQLVTLADRAAATLRALGATPPRATPVADALGGLTPRELDVLAGLQRGDTNAEIGRRLYLSPKTVEHHVGRILAKLGVRSRAEAAAVAARAGV